MATMTAIRRASAAILAALTAAPAPAAFAAPRALDGPATPLACTRLGFSPATERGEMRVGMPAPSYAAPPPPPLPLPSPQPSPQPSPMASPRVGDLAAGKIATPGGFLPPHAPVDTERYPDATPNPVKRSAEEPVSTFSIDVDTAAYSNVRRFLNDGQAPPTDAVRVEELVNYFDYGYAPPTDPARPFSTYVKVAPSPWSAERQVVHIGLKGYDIPRAERPPLNLVFLVDTSGSMWSEDRLPLAQKALNLLVDQLRPQDRVAIVAYAGSAGAVLSPTDGREKLKVRCALDALRAGGSTAGGQGLALAYDLAKQNFDPKAVNRVILMTDGDFNVGVTDNEKLEDFVAAKRKTGVYLSVYGFGRGNYQDARMQALAQNGNGMAAYIDTLAEARRLLRDDLGSSLFPIADDVKIQVEFNPATVSEYRLIGYEARLLNREDFNNDQVDAGEVGSGASVTALYEITPAGAKPSSDPLRYGPAAPTPPAGGELAYLKIRYKLPGKPNSALIERPITPQDRVAAVTAAPEATRWALAVAAFGQKLRGDPRIDPTFGWRQVIELAQGARGEDPFGQRAEFVQLVRAAETARTVNEGD